VEQLHGSIFEVFVGKVLIIKKGVRNANIRIYL
jgi:hypothetical protein